jgi:hypothetical protein
LTPFTYPALVKLNLVAENKGEIQQPNKRQCNTHDWNMQYEISRRRVVVVG